MKLYRFDAERAREIDRFGSVNAAIAPIARLEAATQIGCFYLGPGGMVGYHPATVPQLFLVVAGEGWVTGSDRERNPIVAGQATFWDAGEWHESGTDTGMTAIVVESGGLDPERYLAAL